MDYPSTVLADTPLAYWRFEGNPNDSSGNGETATTQGTFAYFPGLVFNAPTPPGQCGNYDGSGAWVDLPIPFFTGLTSFTVEFLLAWRGGGDYQHLWEFGHGGGDHFAVSPHRGDNGRLSGYFYSGGFVNSVNTPAVFTNNVRHHVVFAVDSGASTGYLYVDGVLVDSQPWGHYPAGIGSPNWHKLGKSSFGDPPYNGLTDEFAIYGYALSGGQVAAHYAALDGFDADVVTDSVVTPPFNANVTIYPGASGPTLSYSVVALNSTHVRATFNVPVLNNDALTAVENYKITRVIGGARLPVHLVVPESVPSPTYVDLTTDEMQTGVNNYDFQIENVEPA